MTVQIYSHWTFVAVEILNNLVARQWTSDGQPHGRRMLRSATAAQLPQPAYEADVQVAILAVCF